MRRLSLLIVLFATACTGGYPARIRPGSNIALPDNGSFIGAFVDSFVCEKARRQGKTSPAPCGPVSVDTLGPGTGVLPPVPPAKP